MKDYEGEPSSLEEFQKVFGLSDEAMDHVKKNVADKLGALSDQILYSIEKGEAEPAPIRIVVKREKFGEWIHHFDWTTTLREVHRRACMAFDVLADGYELFGILSGEVPIPETQLQYSRDFLFYLRRK